MHEQLPPLLMTSDPGSFARQTIVERKPQIIEQVIADNGYPPEIRASLETLRQEIAKHSIRPLTALSADIDFWNREAAAYRGQTWRQLPWYFAETYFYRRLLEAVRYFEPGDWHLHDPFAVQKRRQEQQAVAWLGENGAQLQEAATDSSAAPHSLFEILLHSSLWGNRADLSNFTVREQAQGGLAVHQERPNILIDHTVVVAELLSARIRRVDFVNDNSGRELLFDLALADFLLGQGWVQRVVLHLKRHPFFVSDAMPQDVRAMLSQLGEDPLGQRIGNRLAEDRLVLQDHPFWTTCKMFCQAPSDVAAELAEADLVILKGDVNYRRLLGDRHWPHSTRLEDIVSYFPAPFLVLRTLKGEIMAGLAPGQAEALADQDPDWLINGRRGIIQYVNTARI